ncbi:MAG: hypothetical protein ACK55I_27130, partial [bacterium]
ARRGLRPAHLDGRSRSRWRRVGDPAALRGGRRRRARRSGGDAGRTGTGAPGWARGARHRRLPLARRAWRGARGSATPATRRLVKIA